MATLRRCSHGCTPPLQSWLHSVSAIVGPFVTAGMVTSLIAVAITLFPVQSWLHSPNILMAVTPIASMPTSPLRRRGHATFLWSWLHSFSHCIMVTLRHCGFISREAGTECSTKLLFESGNAIRILLLVDEHSHCASVFSSDSNVMI